ncbi:alpha/beta-hydrolase [Sporormia fimetaria CBS 119925]|uniref:Alpha/beta-hydrolase n=1 Tax=Sporormia fimetaria CBS 119925 TaxID=1340428 RepID=A0A6A6VA37_9PLEO|nr:alpha/beta-hydrolase [Sporormia fimetaria CBS 119925]
MSAFSDAIASRLFQSPSRLTFCLFLGAASLGTFTVLKSLKSTFQTENALVIPSPRETLLPHLSREEQDDLPYPPNALPGARDVDSPYGTFRVYEWGPEDGPRVLMIHGISTPCVALGPLAHELVKKGCRVMLFDLFGRGYSSTPSPSHHTHSTTLFTTQILLTLASSPFPWPHFTLIGYSLGGALAAAFTSYFPHLLSSLFLLAPGGLIRASHISLKTRLLYAKHGLPGWLAEWVVARRLWTPEEKSGKGEEEMIASMEPEGDGEKSGLVESVTGKEKEEKIGGLRSRAVYASASHVLLPDNPNSTISNIVNWQIAHHKGFVASFISSIRYAPIHGSHARWMLVGDYLAKRKQEARRETDLSRAGTGAGLRKVHLVLGEIDPIIIADETAQDVREVLGEEFVEVHVMKGAGHEVAIERAVEIAELVGQELGM